MISDSSFLWDQYLGLLESSPLITKSVTAGIILPAADFSAQLIEKGKQTSGKDAQLPSIDVFRVARFAVFGFFLQAPWNHFYYQLLDSLIPPSQQAFSSTTAIKVGIDQFLQAPVFTVIIFAFLGALEGKSWEEIQKKLKADYAPTMVANWKLWIPAACFNLAFCPPILRVAFVNVVFFFWSIFLSLVVNREEE